MTVREYIDRFEDLYKYAFYIFPNEAQKCYRFKEGLQTVVKNELSLYEGQHFRGWVEKEIEKEKLREEIEQEGKFKALVWARKQKKFSKGAGTSQQRSNIGGFRGNKGPWTWSGTYRPQSSQFNQSFVRQPIASTGSSSRRIIPCTTCGRVHEGGDCRKRTIQCFECGGSGHIRRDCPNLAQFGTSTGRGAYSITGRRGRTFGFGRSTGRGVGASVSREGGASTSTHPIRPMQIERPIMQPRVFAMTQQEAASSHDVISVG